MRVPGLETQTSQHISRRGFTSVATLLTTTMLPLSIISTPRPALASDCSYAALEGLPAVVGKASAAGLNGDARAVKSVLVSEPLLTDPAKLSASLGACAADDAATQDVLKKFAAVRDELTYQSGKNYDPRWQDPEDTADLLGPVKKFKASLEKYLASVPEAQRSPTPSGSPD